jgi:hypothetical protein
MIASFEFLSFNPVLFAEYLILLSSLYLVYLYLEVTNSVFTLQASSFLFTSIYSISRTALVLLDHIYTVFSTEVVLLLTYSVFSAQVVFQLGAARYIWKTQRQNCKASKTVHADHSYHAKTYSGAVSHEISTKVASACT